MQNKDILFREEDGVFSYRVAGVLIQNGRLLLHGFEKEPGYAFPGGHPNFGEESTAALIREFKEEINADVLPLRLLWVGENFIPWDNHRTCHQLSLYYEVQLQNGKDLPQDGSFLATESFCGREFQLQYEWVPLEKLGDILLYPTNAKDLLMNPSEQVQHFIYRQSL